MPPDDNIPGQLSAEAFAEFKAAYQSEFPQDKISDGELHARAWSVLRVFDILVRLPAGGEGELPNVSDDEAPVLAYLRKSIVHEDRSPSVRDIAEVAGFSSSRSGMRLVERFIERSWASRDEEGNLKLAEWLNDCKTKLLRCDV